MAQNITLLGASYSDVPAVQLPKSGGGLASFTDVTDTTATASDVAQGKYFYTSSGVRTAGAASGGGSSMNVQVAQSTTRATSSTYTNLVSLTCDTAGKYDIYWSCFRTSIGGTSGSQLYINGSAQGTANTTFTNNIQNNHSTGITLAKDDTVAVYARSRGSNYFAYVGTLTIKQTS